MSIWQVVRDCQLEVVLCRNLVEFALTSSEPASVGGLSVDFATERARLLLDCGDGHTFLRRAICLVTDDVTKGRPH